ncbi:MAG: HTH domain-containing protein [Candidatus Diapherotrites archaeon]|nr:HTH domain-containing protein [Candidatus Diapherotrites archaeon]
MPISKNRGMTSKEPFRLPKLRRSDIAERRKKLIEIITRRPGIPTKELATMLGISQDAVQRDLFRLSLEPETMSIVAEHKRAIIIKERRRLAALRQKVVEQILKGVRSKGELARKLKVGEQSIRTVIGEIKATGSWHEREAISLLRKTPHAAQELHDPRQRKLIKAYLEKFNSWSQKPGNEIKAEMERLKQEIKSAKGEIRDLLQMEINALNKILENRSH